MRTTSAQLAQLTEIEAAIERAQSVDDIRSAMLHLVRSLKSDVESSMADEAAWRA